MLKYKKKGLLFAAICVFVLILAVLFQVFPENTADGDLPKEVSELVENYMNAYKISTHESVKYMHFENDFVQSAYRETNSRLIDYEIESTKKINDNLYAFTINIKTLTSLRRYGDVYRTAYNFAARIDGKWYYLNGISHVPPDLLENLNPDDYTYDDNENKVNPNDILGALDFSEEETQHYTISPE